ncbi:MAG: class I SAM-dependent RNA methyltransferase [Flavobacteriaceae bacterium]|nr:class I SAM-dependent RNA methyltransferase [Flavobacteriaceae bacterium]
MEENNDFKIVAKTLYGLEDVLANELLNLGAKKINIGVRNVSFYGDKGFLYKSNLALRSALKILKPIAIFEVKGEKDLYSSFLNFNWEDFISINDSFAIESVLNSDFFNHSLYVSQKAKDGLVDRFRKLFKSRPSVDSINPDIKINIHIRNTYCTVSLDSSGKPLNQRGYRTQTNIAPINEVLAAGIIILSDWKIDNDFLDPMCGSGTFLIEAAMIANNYPPNINRTNFSFQNWKDYDQDLFELIKDSVLKKVRPIKCNIFGYDISSSAISKSKNNINNSGFENSITVEKLNFFKTKKEHNDHLHILFNPPYGERLLIDIESFYKNIGDTLKTNYPNSSSWFITSSLESLKHVGLRSSRKIKLYNGKLDSRLVKYDIYSGSKKMKN